MPKPPFRARLLDWLTDWLGIIAFCIGSLLLLAVMLWLLSGKTPDRAMPWELDEPGTVTFHGAPPGRETVVYRSVDCDTGLVIYISESGDIAAVPASLTWLDAGTRCAAGQGWSQ